MRIAILSDIHSNFEALAAVSRHLARHPVDSVLHLGDITGYNADPEECVRWAMEHVAEGVSGNHDNVACGNSDATWFNHGARQAALYSRDRLSGDAKGYLRTLPASIVLSPEILPSGILLTHGAPTDPNGYIDTRARAMLEVSTLRRRGIALAFVGHTHTPALFVANGAGLHCLHGNGRAFLPGGMTYIVNVGSVGQPRDGDPRACFAVLDTVEHEVEWVRVEYDVEKCQKKVLAAGLPPIFAQRLRGGF